jgi:hypothetical protein
MKSVETKLLKSVNGQTRMDEIIDKKIRANSKIHKLVMKRKTEITARKV